MAIRDRIRELRRVKARTLVANPANFRLHPASQKNALQAILEDVGYADALLAREENGVLYLIDGHLRADTTPDEDVPVLILDVTKEEADRILLTHDPIGAMADTDARKLEELMASVSFEDPAIKKMLATLARESGVEEPDAIEDEVPSLPSDSEIITEPGDLWLLGRHRLLCGDSTKLEAARRLVGDQQIAMMFTDPPWNVGIGLDSNPRHRQRPGLKNDKLSAEDFQAFLDGFIGVARAIVQGDLYCVLGASEWPRLDASLRAGGFHWSATVIWVKDIFVPGRSKYHRRYEPIWYGWHKDAKSSFAGRRDLDDVWEIARPKRSEEHPTMKPVELGVRAIRNSSQPRDNVLDLFGGSGSTLIAAEQSDRNAFLMELEPGYCDVIVKRYETFTGKKAERIPASEPAAEAAGSMAGED